MLFVRLRSIPESPMPSAGMKTTQPRRSIGDYALPFAAVVLVVAGAVRFLLARKFGLSDAVWILVDVPLAALLLLVADYVHFHTRINMLVLLMVFLLLAISSSAFSIGLGIVLMGVWIFNSTH